MRRRSCWYNHICAACPRFAFVDFKNIIEVKKEWPNMS